ncbi:MAG: hypothetical protein NC124_16590, partial [Clostridium sp.]|nr:hypothetical protein [Clostridium sp.]
KIDESEDEQLKEIWSLIDKKLEIVFDGNQAYDSDGQKYKAFLKNVSQTEGLDQRMEEIFSEDKIKRADAFLAQHDALYAEQMATVMDTIHDGMQVAQEIYRRMASGAKVSQSDERSLMEYDPRMYMAAKNAQMMAKRQKDMSKESLIEKFEERHANDRKDWTSELDQQIQKIQQSEKQESGNAETAGKQSAVAEKDVSTGTVGNIDISI